MSLEPSVQANAILSIHDLTRRSTITDLLRKRTFYLSIHDLTRRSTFLVHIHDPVTSSFQFTTSQGGRLSSVFREMSA